VKSSALPENMEAFVFYGPPGVPFRETVAVAIFKEGQPASPEGRTLLHLGIARTGKNEKFNGTRGRDIALGRALTSQIGDADRRRENRLRPVPLTDAEVAAGFRIAVGRAAKQWGEHPSHVETLLVPLAELYTEDKLDRKKAQAYLLGHPDIVKHIEQEW